MTELVSNCVGKTSSAKEFPRERETSTNTFDSNLMGTWLCKAPPQFYGTKRGDYKSVFFPHLYFVS